MTYCLRPKVLQVRPVHVNLHAVRASVTSVATGGSCVQADLGTMADLDRRSSMAEVVKPALDKLQYRCVTLQDNGIRITLISDADADKAAAAMDVSPTLFTLLRYHPQGSAFCQGRPVLFRV